MTSNVPISRRQILGGLGAGSALLALGGRGLIAASPTSANTGPSSYSATWSSVDQHPAAPEWFQEAKFGIYVTGPLSTTTTT